MKLPITQRLEVRLVVTVGISLLVFSLIAGFFTYRYSYRQQLELADSLEQQLVQTVQAQAEVAAYAANQTIAEGVLNGLLANPVILAARIEATYGFRVERGSGHSENFASGKTYPLFSPVDHIEPIGTLEVLRNHAQVNSAAAQTALFQTVLMLAQVLAAVAIMAAVLRFRMINPITRLAHAMVTIQPGSSNRLTIEDKHSTDEIGLLSKSANTILDAAEVAMTELTERDQAKSRFFAAASHDLRQPIHAMHLFLDALKKAQHKEDREDQAKLIQSIETASQTLNELLESLLDISKLDAGAITPQPHWVNVEEFFARIDNNFSTQALQQHLRFKLWFPQQPTALYTDKRLLNIILANLTGNALKNTTTGGVLVALRQRGGACVFQVWDTGTGIGREHLDRIYDEFYQVANPNRDRKKGLGLGLAIARRISRLLGYELACRSTPGKGSVFEVRIPLTALRHTAAAPGAATPGDAADVEIFRGKRLAVLEDDELVAQALKQWLTACGIEVCVFDNAECALADAKALAADYYIVDYQLAGTLNGFEFLDAVQRRRASALKAVMITGNTSGQFIEMAAKFKWPVLFKPADPLHILATLEPDPAMSDNRNPPIT